MGSSTRTYTAGQPWDSRRASPKPAAPISHRSSTQQHRAMVKSTHPAAALEDYDHVPGIVQGGGVKPQQQESWVESLSFEERLFLTVKSCDHDRLGC